MSNAAVQNILDLGTLKEILGSYSNQEIFEFLLDGKNFSVLNFKTEATVPHLGQSDQESEALQFNTVLVSKNESQYSVQIISILYKESRVDKTFLFDKNGNFISGHYVTFYSNDEYSNWQASSHKDELSEEDAREVLDLITNFA